MTEEVFRGKEKPTSMETSVALDRVRETVGIKKDLDRQKAETQIELIQSQSGELAKVFEEKIKQQTGKTPEELKKFAMEEPEKFGPFMANILGKVMQDKEVQAVLSKMEVSNPGISDMFEGYVSDAKFYFSEKWKNLKSETMDSWDDFKAGFENFQSKDLGKFNFQEGAGVGALSVATGYFIHSFFGENDGLKPFLMRLGIGVTVASNEAVGPVILNTLNTGLEATGKVLHGGWNILHESVHAFSSGEFLGRDRLSKAEKVKFYNDIKEGVKHFPPHIQVIWRKMLKIQNGEKLEEKEKITDTDIQKSAYYAFSALDQQMGPLEMVDFLAHLEDGKTPPEKYQRFLLTTSAGGLANFFMNEPAYADKFNHYLQAAKKEWQAGKLKQFSLKDLGQATMFKHSVPPDISREKLDGIAKDFNLGASGMVMKYLLMIWGLSIAIGLGTGLMKKSKEENEPKSKKKTNKGEKILHEALRETGDHQPTDKTWSNTLKGLTLMGVIKSKKINFFSNKDEQGSLDKLSKPEREKIFKALVDKEKGWKAKTTPDDLDAFRKMQDEFWGIVKEATNEKRVKKMRYGELGKFEDGLKLKDVENGKKSAKARAYRNLQDLLEIKEALEASKNKDFGSGMSLWQMIKNPVKFSYRKIKGLPKSSIEKVKNASLRINRRGKIDKMRGTWKGEFGIFLGNMEILGVPRHILDDLKEQPKDQRMAKVYERTKEVMDLYKKMNKGTEQSES